MGQVFPTNYLNVVFNAFNYTFNATNGIKLELDKGIGTYQIQVQFNYANFLSVKSLNICQQR